MKSVYIIIHF